MNSLLDLPKAELHLHVEGTLEPEMAFALAERNGVQLPFAGVEDLRSRYAFTDLQSFLDLYYACMSVLRTRQDFEDLATAYLDRAHAQGVRHVEMFVDPQVHLRGGVALEDVLDGLLAALRRAGDRYGMTGGLIPCFLRDLPATDAMDTLERLAPRAAELLGVGLDSAEVGHPAAPFAEVFARARSLGLHLVAHAGEEGPPAYVREALDLLGVERVDHGVRVLEDPELVARLRAEQVPLTVCPLSNVRLGGVASMGRHPLPRMLDAGLLVTVNSDDPAYFGGYVGDNFTALRETFGFDAGALADLAANSVRASFAPESRKAELQAQIEAWREAAGS
ncbi:adenosine deaminase [Georgenia sp. AZ-5]|uniref:adenosine deaminase n=1 Tax=Georgenia sp. AZ-5 TaxID=3367526 RepID=UPI0037549735